MSTTARNSLSHFVRRPGWLKRRGSWGVAGLVLLYALAFNGQWRMGPDTAIYLEIGRNIVEGRGFVHPTGLQHMANPGLPHLIAGIMRVLPQWAVIPALLLVMQLCAAAILTLNYILLRLHTNRDNAIAATALLAISALFFRMSLEILTDIPFMLGVMLMLVGWELWMRRGRLMRWATAAWGLIALGLALMAAMRIVVLVPAAALLLTLLIQALRQRRYKLLALAACVAIAPVLLRLADPRPSSRGLVLKERQILQRFLDLPDTLANAWHTNVPMLIDTTANMIAGQNVFESWCVPEILLTIAVFGFALTLNRKRVLWQLMVGLFLVQWLLFLPDVRYTLPILPLVVFGWWRASRWVVLVGLKNRLGLLLGSLMIAFFIFMNLLRVGGEIVEQRGVPFDEHYRRGSYQQLPTLAMMVGKVSMPDVWLVARNDFSAPLTFMARRPCVSHWDDGLNHIPPGVPVYLVTPLDDATAQALAQHPHWRIDPEASLELPRSRGRAPLQLHRIEREETP